MGRNIFRIDRARAIRPLSQSIPSPSHVHACSAQLVKLAVGCLNELAPVRDDHWAHCEEDDGPSVGASSSGHGPGGVAHKMAGLSIGRSSGGVKDELGVSTSHASISSVGSARSAGSAGSSSGQQQQQQQQQQQGAMGRQGSGGSDAGGSCAVPRRPSFLLGLLGKKESSGSGAEANSGASSSVPTGSKSGMGAFFSDSGKKSGSVSATSPHGTGLSHSGFGRWVVGQCSVNAWWDVCAMTGITDREDENVPTVECLPPTATIHRTTTDEGPVMERLTKRLMQMKLLLYGDGEKEVDKEKGLVRRDLCVVCGGCALCLFVHWLTQYIYLSIRSTPQELAQHIIGYNMMPLLLDHFTTLPFEARKDAAMIFSNMAKHNTAGACVRACVGWMARSAAGHI